MSFLSPWFFAGLLLVAGPIIAHLIRRATKDRIAFSALRFLSPSTPRLDRRSRIQHPLLLAIRCLIIALLVLAFARPYWMETAPPMVTDDQPRLVIALLDRSASMQREGRWEDAIDRVETIAQELGDSDAFVLIAFDSVSESLITAEQWQQTLAPERPGLVTATLRGQSPTWQATWVDNAVARALETVREVTESLGGTSGAELIIVSDLTTGTRLSGLAGLDWPDNAVVRLESVDSTASTAGFALHWLGWGADNGLGAPARVRISGDPPPTPQPLSLQLLDAETNEPWGDPHEIVMSTSGTQLVSIPVSNDAPAALQIDLLGDHSDLGRSLYVVRDLTREVKFQIWGDTDVNDTRKTGFYLQSATAGWRDPHVVSPTDASPNTPALHVVTGQLSAAERTELQQQLIGGAFVLVLADSTELIDLSAHLAGESGWQGRSLQLADPLLFGQIDFTHPLFASFADPRFSDFTRIRFSNPVELTLPADSTAAVVARFDNRKPAVLESTVGSGRLVVWATGWSPQSSPWVLSTKFVPWLQALAERATGGNRPVAVTDLSQIDRLELPSNAAVLDVPGVFTVEGNNNSSRLVGLNVPPSETQNTQLSWDSFEEVGMPLANNAATTSVAARQSGPLPESGLVSESRQRAWRWFILIAVGLLIIEGLLAMYFNRRASPEPKVVAPTA